MERKSIGTFIAALRRANGMTQKDLAEKLSVSDKAVSRWERDESLPDLMLLPVIADIFHITVDELLRGERKPEDAQGIAADPVRLKKQTKRMLIVQLNRLRNRNYIVLGIGALGVLAAIICNFGLSRGFVGFCVGVVCVAFAAVIACFFQQGAMQAADDEDFDQESVHWYKETVAKWNKRMLVMLSATLSFCLPMVLAAAGNSYGYRDTFVTEGTWLLGSAMCLSTLETIASYVFWRMNGKCDKLHGIAVRIVCFAMAVTLLSFALVPDVAVLARKNGMVYTDLNEFLEDINDIWQNEQENGYSGYHATTAVEALHAEVSAEEAALEQIYDTEGNVLASFHRPYSVTGIRCTFDADGEISTIMMWDEWGERLAATQQSNMHFVLSALYILEPLMAYGVYCLLNNQMKGSK